MKDGSSQGQSNSFPAYGIRKKRMGLQQPLEWFALFFLCQNPYSWTLIPDATDLQTPWFVSLRRDSIHFWREHPIGRVLLRPRLNSS